METVNAQWWVFWSFFLGFAVKVPMFPFHTWLPDAHTEAPTAGSVILASVLLKMGTYGFLRFSIPLLPDAAKDPKVIAVVSILSIIGIVYGALASLMQRDWKKLVAYSSVSHLGFCTLSIFALNQPIRRRRAPCLRNTTRSFAAVHRRGEFWPGSRIRVPPG
jgi:NADH-quinone oxidoreductase subunit M